MLHKARKNVWSRCWVSLICVLGLLMGLSACGRPDLQEGEAGSQMDVTASASDIAQLDALYAGKQPYHGELHDHADTGGTSDGKTPLKGWKDIMMYTKDMDFATIVDHKQVLHMRLEDWDDSIFIGGSEAAAWITDKGLEQNELHYNMIFATPEPLEELLYENIVKHQFDGTHFKYAKFTTEEFMKIADSVRKKGGFFVHVHPKGDSYILSDDPLDYWFGDYTGLEVICGCYGGMEALNNKEAYQLWKDLLAMGKRVYATSGSDSHRTSNTVSLTTIYSDQQNAQTYLNYVRQGNFTAGPVGIRMCIGDAAMGAETSFSGNRVVVSAGDVHSLEFEPTHIYRVDLYDDTGLVFSQEADLSQTVYFAVDADETKSFYRAEVYDVTEDRIVAVGNPIWNG